MKRFSALFVLIFCVACVLAGCAKNLVQKSDRNIATRTNRIAIVFDSSNPMFMVPETGWFEKHLKEQGIEYTLLDMGSHVSGYEDALNELITTDIGGLIISLPYDSRAELLFTGAMKKGIKILQVGGDYYPSDISVSIDFNQVGYMLGRELGERLNKRDTVPRVLFISLENGWKEIETGFIEGLREMTADGYIVGRLVISADASIAFSDGEANLSHVNGVAAFFCDTDSSAVSYSTNAIQVRAVSQNSYRVSDNLKAVLLTVDDGTTQTAVSQLLDLLDGKRTDIRGLIYKPVFVYNVSE